MPLVQTGGGTEEAWRYMFFPYVCCVTFFLCVHRPINVSWTQQLSVWVCLQSELSLTYQVRV